MNEPDPLVDLLADHDAGLPVDPSVLTDPQARGVLDALAATRAELAAFRREPVPAEFAGRWDAALAEAARTGAARTGPDRAGEAGRSGPPTRPRGSQPPDARSVGSGPALPPSRAVRPGPPVRPADRPGTGPPLPGPGARAGVPSRPSGPAGPRRRGRGRPAVLAGLVLVVVLVVAGVVGVRRDPPSVTAAQLGGIARASLGIQEAGPFADPLRREACLRAVGPPGLAPDVELAAGRSVVFEGQPGVLLVLLTGRLATFHVVVVTPDCRALLADTVFGP